MLQATRLIVSRQEAECILNCLCGNLLKSEKGLRETIRSQIEGLLRPTAVKKNGWAPMGRIKPSWPSNFTRPSRKIGSRKSRDKNPVEAKPAKVPQTAEQILAGLSL